MRIIKCDGCLKEKENDQIKGMLQVMELKFFGKKGNSQPEVKQLDFCRDCLDKIQNTIKECQPK